MEFSNNSTRNKPQSSKMSSASSSANEYEQYIKQYYIKKGESSSTGLSFTHTRIPSIEHGVTGGTFCIPPEQLPEFWTKYSKHVITNRRHEYLTEKQLQGAGRFLLIWILGMDLISTRVSTRRTILKILSHSI